MANKYLIHGAAFCGDGTASNEAVSDGAAGAWNNINVYNNSAPAFGALAAGDVVYIRSKSSAGADITITHAVAISIGSSLATTAAWITWILDSGNVWPGISGILTVTTAANVSQTLLSYNELISEVQDAIVFRSTEISGSATGFVCNTCKTHNLLIDHAAAAYTYGKQLTFAGNSYMANLHYKSGNRYNQGIQMGDYVPATLIDPDIELLSSAESDPVIKMATNGSTLTIYGGRVHGVGSTSGQTLIATQTYSGRAETYGFKLPSTMSLAGTSLASAYDITGMAFDDGPGASIVAYWGNIDSRNDGNYPYLNATLPNSALTGWAWKMYPKVASKQRPARVSSTLMFVDSAAAKTITQEFLLSTAFTALNAGNCWIELIYIDNATGDHKHVSSSVFAGSALASSAAAWSATTYGAISFDKKSISITTPTAVKQDSAIICTLFISAPSVSANDILFVDPAFWLS